jgi:hypothetical protein
MLLLFVLLKAMLASGVKVLVAFESPIILIFGLLVISAFVFPAL